MAVIDSLFDQSINFSIRLGEDIYTVITSPTKFQVYPTTFRQFVKSGFLTVNYYFQFFDFSIIRILQITDKQPPSRNIPKNVFSFEQFPLGDKSTTYCRPLIMVVLNYR